MKIYVELQGQPMDAGHRRRLTQQVGGETVIFGDTLPDAEARRKAVADADVVFGNLPLAWLEAAPRLRWVQLDSAGIDAYLKLADAGKVKLSNLADFYPWAVSECAMAGILAFYRKLPELCVAQPGRLWIKEEVSPLVGQLHGARTVVLGAGSIGKRLASLLRAFECPVRLYARTAAEAQLRTPAELDAALPETDLLINTLPHTPQTAGFLDRPRFARLRRGALFANVGRGSAVDEVALVEAIDRGQLSGAVLDVTAVEPLPTASPLWGHPKVLLTQHTGGRFPGETDRKLDVFLGNLGRLARGERLEGLVVGARGY